MSRCQEWNNALEGISKYIKSKNILVNKNNFFKEVKIINKYCKINNLEGSLSSKVLKISSNFQHFKNWIDEKYTIPF